MGTARLKYDLTGRRFGRLLVLSRAGGKWSCRCDCGTEKSIASGNLRSGAVVSCGCHRSETLAAYRRSLKRAPDQPCKNGHITRRRVDGSCVECQRLVVAKNRARNAEKARAYSRKSHQKHAIKRRAAWLAWKRANLEKVRARARELAKVNPSKVTAKAQIRRVMKLQRMPVWADPGAMTLVYRAARIAAVTWPEEPIHVDHDIPLLGKLVSGLHVHANLRIVRAQVNLRKSNRFEP